MANLRAMFLGVCAAAFMYAPPLASADELITPPLREGAIVCEPDPETGLRAVFLPAVFHKITEIMVLQDAQTELVYVPLRVSDKGDVISRAHFVERMLPHKPIETVRWVVFLPVQIGYIHKNGLIWNSSSTALDEQANIDKIKAKNMRIGTAQAQAFREQGWPKVIAEYHNVVDEKRQSFRKQVEQSNNRPLVSSKIQGVEVPNNLSISDLKVSEQDIFTAILLPRQIEFATREWPLPKWQEFAQSARNNLGWKCNGPQLSEKHREIPDVDFDENPIFIANMPVLVDGYLSYMYFNIKGRRLLADELEQAGYDKYIVRTARTTERLWEKGSRSQNKH